MTIDASIDGSQVLYANKVTWSAVFLGCGFGIWTCFTNETVEIFWTITIILCCSTGAVASVISMWPGSSWLEIGAEGVRWSNMFRQSVHYRRRDINSIGIINIRTRYNTQEIVELFIAPENIGVYLPDLYGKNASHLVKILEAYRSKYRWSYLVISPQWNHQLMLHW